MDPRDTRQSPNSQGEGPVTAGTCPVVGVGASAGGLEAFSQFLTHLPNDTGLAFVLVQHLDPKHDSKLDELLAKWTAMPVLQAADNVLVEANHVYVIPPNTLLMFAEGRLRLAPRSEGRGPHLPIDHFLKSLAQSEKGASIGVILSGTGTDGTAGMHEIKGAGGITFAQDERTAKYPGMPTSAARSGCVDRVLPPEEIARELSRIAQHPYLASEVLPARGAVRGDQDADFKKVLALLRVSAGIDFSGYRDTTLRRRISRRMLLHGNETLAEYGRQLADDRAELESLSQDILINVTSFFREPESFEAIKTHVLPRLMQHRDGTPIRIWVPGCSTGQEAYSLGITILEFLADSVSPPRVQIFATDVSDAVSLHHAREGVYPHNIESEVSPERLQRFFTREDGKYRVTKMLRDMVLFAKQNVIADPPFSRLDLISCRNLLIYLTLPVQKRVIPTFHYALNPGGFLALGHAESVGPFTDLFGTVDAESRIFVKLPAPMRQYPHFQVQSPADRRGTPQAPALAAADWHREADRVAVGHYAPPGVLVNDNLDILQFRGQTGPYLAPAPGEPSLNLLKMAREGLFVNVRAALNESRQTGKAAHKRGVRVRGEGVDREIDLHVLPVTLPQAGEHCYLVLFEETLRRGAPREATEPADSDLAHADASELAQTLQELASTREYMQSIIEQQEAANEELHSANEEILSTNEELQSTNEELETAKEELQSINEELTTVNEQLHSRNADLGRLNDDFANLLGSSGVPMVVVGTDLRIRRFTPAAAKLFDLTSTDAGRPIASLRLPVVGPELEGQLRGVLETVQMRQFDAKDEHGRWHSVRLFPYRTSDNRIDGVVLVLADIDALRRSRDEASVARAYAEAIVRTVRDPLLVLRSDLRVDTANEAFYKTFQVTPETTEGRFVYELGEGQWEVPALRNGLERVMATGVILNDVPVVHDFPRIGRRHMLLNARRLESAAGEPPLILLAIEDVTDRENVEREKAEAARIHAAELAEATRRKDEFLAMLAHELRNPLAPLRHALQIAQLSKDNPELLRTAFAMMDRQVDLMVRLIDDLLDVSRITRGQIDLRLEPVDLASSLQRALEVARPLCDSMQQNLTLDLGMTSLFVSGDRTRLDQIVLNLVTNACKFTDRGGCIDLMLERENDHALIRVRDNGIGISAEELPRVFEMFSQIDNARDRSRGGLGVGLALVKKLVEMHGGTVQAESAGFGRGSEFVVRLPILETPEVVAASHINVAEWPRGRSRRILVVDDNRDAASSLSTLMSLAGHETSNASDGAAAVRLATSFRPDVVLLDIGLPDIDGYEVARKIRAQPWGGGVLLIAVTGRGTAEDRERSSEAGFDAHFAKPVDHVEILRMIDGDGKTP